MRTTHMLQGSESLTAHYKTVGVEPESAPPVDRKRDEKLGCCGIYLGYYSVRWKFQAAMEPFCLGLCLYIYITRESAVILL